MVQEQSRLSNLIAGLMALEPFLHEASAGRVSAKLRFRPDWKKLDWSAIKSNERKLSSHRLEQKISKFCKIGTTFAEGLQI